MANFAAHVRETFDATQNLTDRGYSHRQGFAQHDHLTQTKRRTIDKKTLTGAVSAAAVLRRRHDGLGRPTFAGGSQQFQ